MTLKIMNCFGDVIDVDIGKLDDVLRISVLVLSGDEILKVLKRDGSQIEEDSDRHERSLNFYDGEYTIYDPSLGVNKIEEWNKREDSNEWVM